MIPDTPQEVPNDEAQAISLDNICTVDGSWISIAQFNGCGWVWKDSLRQIQLMGMHNFSRREFALHSEVEALKWAMENMLLHSSCQSFGTYCKDLIAMIKGASSFAKFCDWIGNNKDARAMLFGIQNLSHPKSTKWNIWFVS